MDDVEISLVKMGTLMLKQHLACACCHYDAAYLLRIDKLERLFCERCLLNVMFDALNFNVPAESV